jgi:hypothetical protein
MWHWSMHWHHGATFTIPSTTCGSIQANSKTQRSIPLALKRIRVRHLPERFGLFSGEPVTKANAEVLRPFDSPDAGSKIRAEETGISSFVRKPTDGREPAVNRTRRKLA